MLNEKNKSIIGWAMYDWANSVFVTVVIAGFFPIVFKTYWAADLNNNESTFWLGVANALASLAVVVIAPFLGAIGDRFYLRKELLLAAMIVGVVTTAALSALPQGDWMLVVIFYVITSICFMVANVFYDALLIPVSAHGQIDKISGMGYGLGYLGGGLSLAACVYLSQQPEIMGYSDPIDVVLMCFILVALWWFLFSLPLAVWTKDSKRISTPVNSISVFRQTYNVFKTVFSNPQIRLFLIA